MRKKKLEHLQKMQKELDRGPMFEDYLRDSITRIDAEIKATRSSMERLTLRFLRFPPWHARHQPELQRFHKEAPYDKSVFIMTKFPDGATEVDEQLRKVVQATKDAVVNNGLNPRIANSAKYHDWLWDEIEMYLLGCSYGIAIIEDKYRPELNPNIAMEWGWMRAMGKRVLFLQEESFSHGRADFGGLRAWKFSWDNPEPGITQAIQEWAKQ